MEWLAPTLRRYPEIAIFLSLGIGYWIGERKFFGFSLGVVPATLLAGILIGQFEIAVSADLKQIFFLMFIFAVGYGLGPQFIRGLAREGLPQAAFAVTASVVSLAVTLVIAKLAQYDAGSAAGFFSGTQTNSMSIGLATDAIGRLLLSDDAKRDLIDAIPVTYAVTYLFGTLGTGLILSRLGPWLLRIDLAQACREYEAQMNLLAGNTGAGWTQLERRAYRVGASSRVAGLTVLEAEMLAPEDRIFVSRIRRGADIFEAQIDTRLQVGDVVAVSAPRQSLINLLGAPAQEVDDPELLIVETGTLEVYVSGREVIGKTLDELACRMEARGVFVARIVRGAAATEIPVLRNTRLERGDIVTLNGRQRDIFAAARILGQIESPTRVVDMAFVGAAIAVGALAGAVVINIGHVPLSLSSAGGTLLAGILLSWVRSVRPLFGRIPENTVWFMNAIGLNIFIATVGISAGPRFVAGLEQLGFSLFFWGVAATGLPLIASMLIGKYLFRIHPALVLGCCAGARTSTASLGMVCEVAQSKIPGLGYTVTYAVSNTLCAIWGIVVVLAIA